MEKDVNLYKEIGNIQGTLSALSVSVSQGFSRAQHDASEFKADISQHIIAFEKGMEKILYRIDSLEKFKTSYDTEKKEVRRMWGLISTIAGIVGSVLFWLVSNIRLFLK